MKLYAAGLWDEVEFFGTNEDAAERNRGYGPFTTFEAAKERASTLSRDPNEGVVVELVNGWAGEHLLVLDDEELDELRHWLSSMEPEHHCGDPGHPLRTLKEKMASVTISMAALRHVKTIMTPVGQ